MWETILNVFMLIVGVFILIKGADIFVASSSSIAKKLKISSLVIGLTVVSFGTSAPELAVSLSASITAPVGATADIAMGNVVGSNIMNILVVLGLSCIITPLVISKGINKREMPFLILSTLVLVAFSFDILLDSSLSNAIVRGEGIVLMFLLILFVIISIRGAKQDVLNGDILIEEEVEQKVMKTKTSIILLILGLAGVIGGGVLVTNGASALATKAALGLGLEESLVTTLVGLTVVAVGTSLPELVTSVIAAKKGENDIAVGNVIGSNIFNTLFIVGASSTVTKLGINNEVLVDIIIMTVVTFILMIFSRKGKLGKKVGILFLCLYALYLTYIILRVFIPALRF